MKPRRNCLSELFRYLGGVAIRLRTDRNFTGLFHVRVIQDIAVDLRREDQKLASEAYAAEQADLEAVKLLEEAARDGFSNADLPAVQTALRHIRRSARIDHKLSEARS
jgi:hypothetical protein